jgi:amino acid transporter/nucleotide-binding universal stress UspA family protein
MLYGDWGTSRLYVLGIAFTLAQFASIYYIVALSILMVFVGWAYTYICRIYPDGGGVYSAAKHVSQHLAVVGALLLIADYVVTAALSTLDGFHYLGAAHPWGWTIGLIVFIGVLNFYGPRRVGSLALLIALATVILFLIIAAFMVPHLGAAHFERPHGSLLKNWGNFVGVILALSGVESIANMTGIMNKPVERTSALSIWPVLLEVAIINVVMGVAMNAIPMATLQGHTEDMVKVLAGYYVGPVFAKVSAVVFALLLFSAANTAIGAIMSVLFLMGRDGELPKGLTSLNRYGVPWIALIVATVIPLLTLVCQTSVTSLASLYAIGVAGAITINVGTCTLAKTVAINRWQRVLMGGVTLVMGAIVVTIAIDKLNALIFATCILGTGLAARAADKGWVRFREAYPQPIPELVKEILAPSAERHITISPEQPRLMVATRGGARLVNYAVEEAERRNAALFVLFVRELAVPFPDRERTGARLEDDKEAQALFQQVKDLAKEKDVALIPIYDSGISAADAILDHAVTLGVECLIMGISKRGALWRAFKGDVLQDVMEILPEQITLLIHA